MITHTLENCSHCGAKNSIITNFAAGEIVCGNCGVVYEDRIIDETYEGRTFSNENPGSAGRDQTRVGGPSNVDEIIGTNITINGKGNSKSKIHRGIVTSNPSKKRTDKRLDELAVKIDFNESTVQIAKTLLSKVEEKKKLKGKNLDSVIGSVFFYTSRLKGIPKTIDDISNKLKLDPRFVRKSFNSIKSIIIEKSYQPDISINALINRYCQSLKDAKLNVTISDKQFSELKKLSDEIGKKINENEILTGRNPKTIAATTILTADEILKLGIGKKLISEIIKTTENTISSAYTELMKYKDYVIPEKYKVKP